MLRQQSLGAGMRLLGRLCDAVYRRAQSIICIAPTMAAFLEARGTPDTKLAVVNNWADENVFRPTERDPGVVERLGLGGCSSVMFAGNIGPVQGLETAIRAAAAVQDLADFRLVLVGGGIAVDSLRALADEIHADNVVFVGPLPTEQMNGITAAADAQLVILQDRPFLRGTIPSKLAAIWASGLPVVCAVAGDAREYVERSGAGWTADSESVEALAGAFRAVHAATLEDRRRRGAAGRTFYETEMARSIGVARIEEILRAAARGRSVMA
jgi:glycosyltransferase involved in cell wall biosynthesis